MRGRPSLPAPEHHSMREVIAARKMSKQETLTSATQTLLAGSADNTTTSLSSRATCIPRLDFQLKSVMTSGPRACQIACAGSPPHAASRLPAKDVLESWEHAWASAVRPLRVSLRPAMSRYGCMMSDARQLAAEGTPALGTCREHACRGDIALMQLWLAPLLSEKHWVVLPEKPGPVCACNEEMTLWL